MDVYNDGACVLRKLMLLFVFLEKKKKLKKLLFNNICPLRVWQCTEMQSNNNATTTRNCARQVLSLL